MGSGGPVPNKPLTTLVAFRHTILGETASASLFGCPPFSFCRAVADVWEKDVWEFQAKSGSSGSCRLFLHFLLGEGKWGRKKYRRIPKCEGRLAGTSPKTFSPPKNSSKQEIWSSQIFRDLSQVVRRTPRDTPVPLYTRTSPWPILTWWAFRPRKKYLASPPPQIPRRHPRTPRPPPTSWENPPRSWDFQ